MADADLALTLVRLLGPRGPEVGCDVVGCPACAEEHESLRALLELDRDF